MNQHSSLSFAVGGLLKILSISNATACSLPCALVDVPTLLSNLDPNGKPIATASIWKCQEASY